MALLYMDARHYKSAFGRFLQPDPSDQEQNLYTYVSNNPVTAVDPSGLRGWGSLSLCRCFRGGGSPRGPLRAHTPVRTPSPQEVNRARVGDSYHGNSSRSVRRTYLYVLRNSSGYVVKWGITSNPLYRYSQSWLRANRLTMTNLRTGPRPWIRGLESRLISRYPAPRNRKL
jgi:uncharacterized protein RhaS with RHS repeats